MAAAVAAAAALILLVIFLRGQLYAESYNDKNHSRCPLMRMYTPLFKAIKLFYALITRVEITSLP